jgi:hypothetical protein
VLGQFSTPFGLCGVDLCDPCWALKGSPPVPYFSHSALYDSISTYKRTIKDEAGENVLVFKTKIENVLTV